MNFNKILVGLQYIQKLEKLGSIRDRMCATAKIALNPEIIAFQ